jgi:hypothetical protein
MRPVRCPHSRPVAPQVYRLCSVRSGAPRYNERLFDHVNEFLANFCKTVVDRLLQAAAGATAFEFLALYAT